jgi:hypothetical protein
MRHFFRTLVCVLPACLAGCVPWPHHVLTAPRISGTVLHSGKPVAGVRVQLADVMTAQGVVQAGAVTQDAVTDAQGHFAIGPIRRFAWTGQVPVLGVAERAFPWGLQLSSHANAWQPGWLEDPTLFGYVVNVPLVARCDLDAASRSSVIGGNESLVGNGSCTLTTMELSK